MLFNSHQFIFGFLPIVVFVFYMFVASQRWQLAMVWVVIASLFFYGWWRPIYVWLLVGSVLFNYGVGRLLAANHGNQTSRVITVGLGIAANLVALGCFKYANFFVHNINTTLGTRWSLDDILLPLAISFFTFQQIAFLVDSYNRTTTETGLVKYCLFVTFFPQLIAGPIVYHSEMMPQFKLDNIKKKISSNLSVGITIFLLGLFKKTVIADGISKYADQVFHFASKGYDLTIFEAWGGVAAFGFQIYFDFSGYSDMAIGLARMFGVILPINFHSPYKALSIIDFWGRWHITLSRFLKTYLYVPLGGNRKGVARQYMNILITMLLGGLWHGAAMTFVVWGGLHGLYLVANHGWRKFRKGRDGSTPSLPSSRLSVALRWGATFTLVTVSWAFFRAESLESALTLLTAMSGGNGLSLPMTLGHWVSETGTTPPLLSRLGVSFDGMFHNLGTSFVYCGAWLLALLLVTGLGPTTQQLMAAYRPVLHAPDRRGILYPALAKWRPTVLYAVVVGAIGLLALRAIDRPAEFIYFQF